ncbi:DUF4179 domain-containing protein [Alkalihalobacterium bogoriense]|uniref:DUF4179 domain-containing protein n=1 Tax=Alkalihalobacterium bogoriense TaxID=246272 RepID=UPI000478D6EE|nr:DUF4179 domain-containing protein [Alkalihalobacterium bogoriense]
MDKFTKFKQDANRIEIPELELNEKIQIAIEEASQSKRKLSISRTAITVVAVAMMFLLVATSGFYSTTMASMLSKIPYIEAVLPFTDEGLKAADSQNLITYVGETVSDQGIEITLTDVYYDEVRFVIGYMIPAQNQEYDGSFAVQESELFIDGQLPFSVSRNEQQVGDVIVGTITTYAELPDEFEFVFDVTQVFQERGNWTFSLPAQKIKGGKEYTVNQTVASVDKTFTVKKIMTTPSATHVQLEMRSQSNEFTIDSFYVYDMNGKRVEAFANDKEHGYVSSSESWKIKAFVTFPVIKDNQTLTIVPMKYEEGMIEEWEQLSVTIPISELQAEPISEHTMYGLRDKTKMDKKTFIEDETFEEVIEHFELDEYQYSKAMFHGFDRKLHAAFYKENQISIQHDVQPLALLSGGEGFLFYKNKEGTIFVWEIKQEKEEWTVIDKKQFDGKSIQDLEARYYREVE